MNQKDLKNGQRNLKVSLNAPLNIPANVPSNVPLNAPLDDQSLVQLSEKAFEIERKENKKKKKKSPKKMEGEILKRNYNIFIR